MDDHLGIINLKQLPGAANMLSLPPHQASNQYIKDGGLTAADLTDEHTQEERRLVGLLHVCLA